jgi:hypothetical protein
MVIYGHERGGGIVGKHGVNCSGKVFGETEEGTAAVLFSRGACRVCCAFEGLRQLGPYRSEATLALL